MKNLHIGTSGWVYDSWMGLFYPRKMNGMSYLEYYSRHFDTAEINYSFYKQPSLDSFRNWRRQVPDGFVFAVKASRFLTHMKKLKDARDPWRRVLAGALELEEKLGPILFQFPAGWKENEERLHEFLELTEKDVRSYDLKFAFEFRNQSWIKDTVHELLEEFGAAICIADSHRFPRDNAITADFTYIRYHGLRDDPPPNYSRAMLEEEAAFIRKLGKQGKGAYVYFNNDAGGHAIDNAQTLKELLRDRRMLKSA